MSIRDLLICVFPYRHSLQLVSIRILDWLDDRIEDCKNPRHFGEPLKGDYARLWRYRVGDYRILCEIQDQKIVFLVLTIGHRRQICKRKS